MAGEHTLADYQKVEEKLIQQNAEILTIFEIQSIHFF